ncbi:hypothetical protein HRbin04_01296 [archaeon HR04]|nr:hypothetical protein HRbin04_01296 [archaeon HR04]
MNKAVLGAIVAAVAVFGFLIAPINLQNVDAARLKRSIETKQLTSDFEAFGVGHEQHQIAVVLPPQDNVLYSGRLTFKADKSVDVAIVHPKGTFPGAVPYKGQGQLEGFEGDLEVYFNVGSEGSWAFNNAVAVALHNAKGEQFNATVTVYYQARAVTGELPQPQVEMPRTIVVSEFVPWFVPSALQIQPGTSVQWDASEAASVHTITVVTRITDLQLNMDKEFTAKTLAILNPGDRSQVWKPDAGVYVYVCAIHPYMVGVISVGVPYNAITGDSDPANDITTQKFASWIWGPGPWERPDSIQPKPTTPGVGEVWVDAQFDSMKDKYLGTMLGKFAKPWPGSINVIDANTWERKARIGQGLNNPHNLWESADGKFVVQTNWHDNYLTVIDAEKHEIFKNYITTGMDPAHVAVTPDNKWVVTGINAGSEFQVFDASKMFDPNVKAEDIKPEFSIRASVPLAGPHGFWLTPDGLIAGPYHMANHIAVLSLNERKEMHRPINPAQLDDPAAPGKKLGVGIPIASYIGPEINGHRYWVTAFVMLEQDRLLQGRLLIYDIGEKVGGPSNPTLVKVLKVNGTPIQSPITPDGRYVVSANSGGLFVIDDEKHAKAAITVVKLDYEDPSKIDVALVIPGYSGTHGVSYGYKQGGGLYAYVTAKFAPVLRVIDVEKIEEAIEKNDPMIAVAGDVDLGDSWGGMGVIAIPNANWYPTLDENPAKGRFQ